MEITTDDVQRFWKYVDVKGESDCWEWIGARYANGYGQFSLRRAGRKTHSSHRIALMIGNGHDALKGKMVCHTCDNRSCVNPKHLYIGTGFENNRDTVIRNRGNRKLGSSCSWAKLTEEDVRQIRASTERQVRLAERYGLCQATISQIKSGKRWKHLIARP